MIIIILIAIVFLIVVPREELEILWSSGMLLFGSIIFALISGILIGAIHHNMDFDSNLIELDNKVEYLNVDSDEMKNKYLNNTRDIDIIFRKGEENKIIFEEYKLSALGCIILTIPPANKVRYVVEYNDGE